MPARFRRRRRTVDRPRRSLVRPKEAEMPVYVEAIDVMLELGYKELSE